MDSVQACRIGPDQNFTGVARSGWTVELLDLKILKMLQTSRITETCQGAAMFLVDSMRLGILEGPVQHQPRLRLLLLLLPSLTKDHRGSEAVT